jgi:hypothetical protein
MGPSAQSANLVHRNGQRPKVYHFPPARNPTLCFLDGVLRAEGKPLHPGACWMRPPISQGASLCIISRQINGDVNRASRFLHN